MPFIPLTYLCPVTNVVVSGWIPEIPPGEAFETVTYPL